MKDEVSDQALRDLQDRVHKELVRIKWLLAAILFLLCLSIIGVGHAVQLLLTMAIVAAVGGGVLYTGLYVFERLVKMKTGGSDADAQLRDYIAEVESGQTDHDTEAPEDLSKS